VRLDITPGGDIAAAEGAAVEAAVTPQKRVAQLKVAPRAFTRYAVSLAGFTQDTVGGKAWHQAQLRGRLPEWIRLPGSVALPFRVFEKVLSLAENREAARRYEELAARARGDAPESLKALRDTVLTVGAPDELKAALREAMAQAGLPWPEDWETAWMRIKQVWASKWNERACLSRQRVGLAHESLVMSVLIQEVVPADYAFVLHTVNPATGSRDEVFGEVVPGLGETLVGNYPGRALSFACHKSSGEQTLLSFPGKSIGLYSDGLIFRSDSNGEDLAGYAGAGLYDSVLQKSPRQALLDYSQEPLVWDEGFRRNLLAKLARIGLELERVQGAPQDIEGAVAGGNYYVVQTRPQVGLE
jgi:alpha-glucan,water dikinase